MANKIEVKKIVSQILKHTPSVLKKEAKEIKEELGETGELESGDITVEDLSDLIESSENLEASQGSLSVTPSTEDREQQY